MLNCIRQSECNGDKEDGIIVEFSGGTKAGTVTEELAEVRPTGTRNQGIRLARPLS